MRILSAPDGCGKTNYIVRWLKEESENPRILLVLHHQEKERICNKYSVSRHQVVTFDQLTDPAFIKLRFPREVEIGVDNADQFLQKIIGNVKIISVCSDVGSTTPIKPKIYQKYE